MMAMVLVVEDEEDLCAAMCEVLTQDGHSVSAVDNAADAVKALGRNAPDIVVLDMILPDDDGISILQSDAMRRRSESLCVLAISGGGKHLPGAFALNLAQAFGANASLYKPFTMAEFKEKVAGLLRTVESHRRAALAPGHAIPAC